MSDSRRPAKLGLDEDTETFYSGAFVSRALRALAELRELWLVSDPYNKVHVSIAVHELLASQTLQEDQKLMAAARHVLSYGLNPTVARSFMLNIIAHRKDQGIA